MSATFVPAQPGLRQKIPVLRSLDLAGPVGRLEAVLNEGVPMCASPRLSATPTPSAAELSTTKLSITP